MKRLSHALISQTGSVDELLERLFPESESTRDDVRHELLAYAATFSWADGPKQHQLYQDVAEIVMGHDSLAFERELLDRMERAEASIKKIKDAPKVQLVLLDDVRSHEAYEFWQAQGYKSIRVLASRLIREARIRALDGELPTSVLTHPSETALDDVECDAKILNNGTLDEFFAALDEAIAQLSTSETAR